MPDTIQSRFDTALTDRALAPAFVPEKVWAGDYARQSLSSKRLAALAKRGPAKGWLLLVETKAVFGSLLLGRFRWLVSARATVARADRLDEATSVEFEKPVFLDFDFQKEEEALAYAADALARDVARFAAQVVEPHVAWKPAPVGPRDAIAFVMVDRFHNGDRSNDGDANPDDPQAFHGGDLQGVLDKLDHLQSLGVTTVWLSPVFRMRTSPFEGHGAYHGYWTEDLAEVEPRFGDEALLRRVADELHRRGMKLLLDLVLNHVGYGTPLVTAHPDWFHRTGGIRDWNDPRQLVDGEVHGLPDLAHENEEVYRYLLGTALGWLDRVHPDGFQLDAVKHVPLAFWARFNDDVRRVAGPDFMLLGEALEGSPTELERTLREGRFTSLFNFPLAFAALDVFCRGAHPGRIGAVLEAEGARVRPLPYVNLLDNHDLPRLAEVCGGDTARMTDALRFLGEAPGIPSLSYGTESAMTGATEPANRADLRFEAPMPLRDAIAESFRDGSRVRGETIAFESLTPERLVWRQGNDTVAAGPATLLITRVGSTAPRQSDAEAPLSFRHAPTKKSLKLVGLGVRLGDWHPKDGVPFRQAGRTLAASALLPLGGVYEFKLVSEDAPSRTEWEPGANRYVLHRGEPVDVAWQNR
jgi:hypothetical protein